jgi:sugar O-acyltransferase (sialic acid O-acetyltransferase NeuD family)
MRRPLIIYGNGQMAESFYSKFKAAGQYDVVAFTVDRGFNASDRLFDLPVIAFEDLGARFPPGQVEAFVAVGPIKNNRIRAAKYLELKGRGYRIASYVSPLSRVSPDARVGENCSLGEHTLVQPYANVEDDVHIGSASIVGHHCVVRQHAYLAVHVVTAGSVTIGERAFIGAGVIIRDNVTVGEAAIVGAGANVLYDIEPDSVYAAAHAVRLPMRSDQARL